jgi:histidine triad (HIT) family protein
MASIFSKIISGQIPSHKISEDENYIAILDAFPLKQGHVLVIPKKEVDDIFDLDPQLYLGLLAFSRKVAIAIKKSIPCKRVSMHVVGLEVPHAHVHLIPINTANDSNFANEKLKLSPQEFEEIANKISHHLH